MHSVVTTFNANMSDNISVKLDVDVLSAKLSNETMANSHEYINYIELINSDDGTGIPSLRHHVLEYVQHKKYTPVGGRQATPYRRLGFVGDALSITLRRGGLRPASRDHADQTSGTHYDTSLTSRETAQPNHTSPSCILLCRPSLYVTRFSLPWYNDCFDA